MLNLWKKPLNISVSVSRRHYEETAVQVLNECYQRDKVSCQQLLVRPLKTWGNKTLLQLAGNTGLQEFLNHTACQTKLDDVWTGRMKPHTPWYWVRVFYFIFLGFKKKLIFKLKLKSC